MPGVSFQALVFRCGLNNGWVAPNDSAAVGRLIRGSASRSRVIMAAASAEGRNDGAGFMATVFAVVSELFQDGTCGLQLC